jgi:[citrate (pro-3S)-lyase] ligase
MHEGFSNFIINTIDRNNAYDVNLAKTFLSKFNIDYMPDECEQTIILETQSGAFVGTGSSQKNVLKFIAVDEQFRGSSAFSQIVSTLSGAVLEKHKQLFIYAHPKNKELFIGLGFNLIAEAKPFYTLFEFGTKGIDAYKKYLLTKAPKNIPEAAAIVVNCNPFTLGHQYLIEKASQENALVYLFVVESDLSVFPFSIRWELIRQGIAHLDNVIMIKSGDYLVSQVSFPNYFLKGETVDAITANQARLDLTVFVNHIAAVLNIKKRYVGTENYCETTSIYNREMKLLLPSMGIQVLEMKRKTSSDEHFISASTVRKALKEGDWKLVKDQVPSTSYQFLISDAAKPIIEKIKKMNSRH